MKSPFQSLLTTMMTIGTKDAPVVGRFPMHYTPRYGSYNQFREGFRNDQARIKAAAERRERKAKRNGYVYTPPAQLRRERNRGRSQARYVTD